MTILTPQGLVLWDILLFLALRGLRGRAEFPGWEKSGLGVHVPKMVLWREGKGSLNHSWPRGLAA